MALKFNLANQLMSPAEMAGFGKSFGESIGGIGLALGEAWNKHQEDQALGQEVDEFTADDDWTTGTRASDAEVERMESEWLSQNPDWVKEGGEFKLYEDSQASKDFDAWAAGPEEGDYSAKSIEQGRQAAQLNYEAAQKKEAINAELAKGLSPSIEMRDMVSPDPFTIDKKSLKKIEIPYSDTPTADDYTAYGEMYGQEALDKKLYEDNRETEIELRQKDLGMHSGASYQGLSTGTGLGMKAGQTYALGSADQISSVSPLSPTVSDRFKQDYSSMLSSMDEGQYFKMDKRTGEYSPTDRSKLDQINLLQQAARSGEMQDLMGGIPEGMTEEEYISKLEDAKRLPGDVGFKYNTAGESWLPEINQTSTSSPNDLDRLLWSKFSNFK